ncbi:carbamoyltransferase [Paenibacillus sp. NPDC057934]|uniref:carbamoyltransferase family protein n=1 Tax=Paenibacillus sp. NPDC057934 TaxID=3346282 RepID=UPI0036D8DB8E
MYILGLGGSDHDVSSCLVNEGRIVCAIEEERVTRKKYGFHSNLLLGHSRNYCLQAAGITTDDLELIVVDSILVPTAYFGVRNKSVVTLNHHMAHASSAFFPSPFEESAILIMDNAGDLVTYEGENGIETVTFAYGKENEITILDKVIAEQYKTSPITFQGKPYQKGDPDDSLGHFYKIISHYCGFDFLNEDSFYFTEDGKTMGLAPYGNNTYYEKLKSYVQLLPEGKIKIDLQSGTFETALQQIIQEDISKDEFQVKADIAYAGQAILEDAVIHLANALYEKTGCENLCIAGGVGLNSVANGKILKHTPFKQLYIQPASGDNGTSIGCALWGHFVYNQNPRKVKEGLYMEHAYLGRSYSRDEVMNSFDKFTELNIEAIEYPEEIAARWLANGKIIAWFQGGAEFGPRALGHRSILANPTLTHMKDEINHRVKFRESFRPFAPAVIAEKSREFFDINQETPFMLIVCDVLPDKRSVLPAITHVDGTARLQTVSKAGSPEFYRLIEFFGELTGVPVVLNTSFNVKGEPIVETPEDALRCFSNTNLDALIIDKFLVTKRTQNTDRRE